jgi:hypothetical protein
MPYKNPEDRAAYPAYDSKESTKKKRAERNKARRMLEAEGVVHKGDGKDVHHKKPLSKGGTTTRKNLKAIPKSQNRTFDRNSDHSIK